MMVFDKQWFEQYQKPLLRFANTRWGRYVLRIHGKRSRVGTRRIIKIEPHAISWRADDNQTTTEFRTHAKYSKRLYHAFKPFWWAMHAWDMAVANNLHESLNLGFDTLTVSPDTSYGSTTVDGYVTNYDIWSSFSTLQTATSGTYVNRSSSLAGAELHSDYGTDDYNKLIRGFATFDTGTIGATATVTAAELDLYIRDKKNALGDTSLEVVASEQSSTSNLLTSDFSKYGSTSFASMAYGDLTVDSTETFTFNASGESHINTTSVTKLALMLGWDLNASFGGTWTSSDYTNVVWSTADETGTSQDPALEVTYYTTHTASVSDALGFTATASASADHVASVNDTISFSVDIQASKILVPVPGKEYVYRIYEADGTFVGTWNDVADEPEFSQRLNTPGTTTTVRLARSASRTIENREQLTDEASDPLTTEAGDDLIAVFRTSNTIGEDTDIELNYNVDIYAHYGSFEELVTEDGQFILTEGSETILVSIGAPLGRRIFSGFVLDYAANYGHSEYVVVTLASHGFELSHEIIKSGSDTTRTYTSQSEDAIIKSILDTNPGTMTYDANSIDATGNTISQTFRLNTKLEGIETIHGQTGEGWYWYGNVGENLIYLKDASSTADHTFLYGKHIKEVTLRRSIEDLRNVVYFVGGDTGGGSSLFKKYDDSTSITNWRQGVHRITDRRYTVATSAENVSDKIISRYKNPVYTTQVIVLAEVYDIETIKLGEMVSFGNFGNFVDDLLLQIVGIRYTPRKVTLDLGELLPRQQDIIDNLAEDIEGEQFVDIPNAPS